MQILQRITRSQTSDVRRKILSIYLFLILINLILWVFTFEISRSYGTFLNTALLAYGFGLRHAVDADHIAAIDNVTRKLMQEGKRPVATGFFFAIGHSSIIMLMSIVVIVSATIIKVELPDLKNVGGLISTLVSASFLYLIGIINLLVLLDIYRMFRRITRGEKYNEKTLDDFLVNRGLLNRFFKPLVRLIDQSWKMFPLGVLFGFGFDTASEVAILGIAVITASKGMPLGYVLLLPALFAAGMALIDTTDGILMLGAYSWAFVKPMRKLYYNLNITFISVAIALLVGTIEVIGILVEQLGLEGPFWQWIHDLDFETLGYIIIGAFALSWLGSAIIYRIKGYDRLVIATTPEIAE